MVPRGNFDGARLNEDETMLTVHGTTEEFTDVVEMCIALVRDGKTVQPMRRVTIDSRWATEYENDGSFAPLGTVTLVGLGRTKSNDAFAWQESVQIKEIAAAAAPPVFGEDVVDEDPPPDS